MVRRMIVALFAAGNLPAACSHTEGRSGGQGDDRYPSRSSLLGTRADALGEAVVHLNPDGVPDCRVAVARRTRDWAAARSVQVQTSEVREKQAVIRVLSSGEPRGVVEINYRILVDGRKSHLSVAFWSVHPLTEADVQQIRVRYDIASLTRSLFQDMRLHGSVCE